MNQIPTATLLVSYTHQDEQEQHAFDALAGKLSAQLNQPVVPCSLDGSGNPLLNGLITALRQGAVKIVTLPLFLSPAEYQDNAVAKAITFASRRWPFVQFHLSPPPDWAEWLRVCQNLTGLPDLSGLSQKKTAIILVGRGDADPDINSDVAKLARLLYDLTYARIEGISIIGQKTGAHRGRFYSPKGLEQYFFKQISNSSE